MTKKYRVKLSAWERSELAPLTSGGISSIRRYKRARVLLLADEASGQPGLSDLEIARLVDVSVGTVERLRRRFVEEGLASALSEKSRPGRSNTFSGSQRAQITALACSTPPQGRGRWTLRLLADKAVELQFVEHISHTTVRKVLKKTN